MSIVTCGLVNPIPIVLSPDPQRCEGFAVGVCYNFSVVVASSVVCVCSVVCL